MFIGWFKWFRTGSELGFDPVSYICVGQNWFNPPSLSVRDGGSDPPDMPMNQGFTHEVVQNRF
jgi:hypothetical protein